MKANRTHQAPPKIEDLGDGTFYYNFNIVEGQTEEGEVSYDYDQVRCSYPIEAKKIQKCLNNENYEHQYEQV